MQTIQKLKSFQTDTVLVENGQSTALVVYPDEPGYEAPARQVADGLTDATGAAASLKSERDYEAADRRHHLICLGRMNNNRLARHLYIRQYILADDWFPGPDGYELRTVCDPWGNGRHVIMLGGSDIEGVSRAADSFCDLLPRPTSPPVFPALIRTGFRGDEHLKEYTQRFIAECRDRFIDRKSLDYGAERMMIECAEMYMITGLEIYAETYAAMIRRWLKEYYRWTPYRQLTHVKYLIPAIIRTFDSIEHSPRIRDDLKLELTNLLLDYCARLAECDLIMELQPDTYSVGGMHDVGRSLVYGVDYFRKHYPELDIRILEAGLERARIGQQTLAASDGFIEKQGGYTPSYPRSAMQIALTLDDFAYFESGAARRWMSYCMLNTDSLGRAFFGKGGNRLDALAIPAWYYGDAEYVWYYNWVSGRSSYHPRMTASEFDRSLWIYLPNLPPKKPREMTGLRFMPLHRMHYEQLTREGKKINVPRERTFHALSMRSGLEPGASYLRLTGINDGLSGGGEGNAISLITARGKRFLEWGGPWGGGHNMKWHNSVLALRNGMMEERLTALCELRLAADLPACAFTESVMPAHNGTEWTRGIVWIKGRYWVVIDRLRILEAADYSLICQWYLGNQAPRPSGAGDPYRTSMEELVVHSAGGPRPYTAIMRGTETSLYVEGPKTFLRQAVHRYLEPGATVTFAHLMYVRDESEPADYYIERLSDRCFRVSEPDRQTLIGTAPDGEEDHPMEIMPDLRAACAMYALTPEENAFARLTALSKAESVRLQSELPVDLQLDAGSGRITAGAREPTRLQAQGAQSVMVANTQPVALELHTDLLNPQNASLGAGGIGDAIRSMPAAPDTERLAVPKRSYPGHLTRQWQFTVPGGLAPRVVQGVHSLNDNATVLVGAGQGGLDCLDAGTGKPLWSFPTDAPINDLTVADFGEGPRILTAGDDGYIRCLDAQANELWTFTGAGIECIHQAPGEYGAGRYVEGDGEMTVVTTADLEGNGKRMILAGSKTFMHAGRRVFGTLWCLDAAGKLQWHLYQSAGAVTGIVPFLPDGGRTLLIHFGTGGGVYGRRNYVCDHRGRFVASGEGPYGEKHVAVARIAPDGGYRLIRLDQRDGTVTVYPLPDPEQTGAVLPELWSFRAGGMSAIGPLSTELDGKGTAAILVGSENGSLYCLQENGTPPVWRTNLFEPLGALAAGRFGPDDCAGILAGFATKGIVLMDGNGDPLAETKTSAAVLRVAFAPGGGGDCPTLALAATQDGCVTAFKIE